MKKFLRLAALFLALLMISSCFAACKKDETQDDEGGAQNSGVVSTSGGEYVSKLPAQKDFGGEEYLVLGQSGDANPAWRTFEISREELTDDVVGKAVWERNDAIKQKYNLIISEELVTHSYQHIQTFYASNEDKYDMIMVQLIGAFGHIQSGYHLDLTSVDYVDFEHPSWNDYTIEQFTFGDAVYMASSDFNLQNKAQLSCIFYNREMARDAGDGYLEDIVSADEWTLDKYNEIVSAYSEDVSGNGVKGDEEDVFGSCGDMWNFLGFAAGAGYRASTVVDGNVQMAGAGDNILNILDKVGKFFFNSQAHFITEAKKPLDYYRSQNIFKDGRALCFAGEIVDYDEGINEVSFEVGVLPFPKYDSAQKDHYTQVNFAYSSLCAIPKTVFDVELAGFGLQVLAEYSTDTTYEAYIETKCKLQDSFDQRMSDMYEIIFENPVYDLVILGDFGNIRRAMISEIPTSKQTSRYSTLYSAREESAQEEIDELKEDLGLN